MDRLRFVVPLIAVALAVVVYAVWRTSVMAPLASVPAADAPSGAGPVASPRYVFNVTLHRPEEIDRLLMRAEELAGREPLATDTGIALVLHGPEIEMFRRANYARFQAIVDRAAQLDARGVIDVKMCQTEMRNRRVARGEIPDFIELVPFGPEEIERLKQQGYIEL